MSTKRSKLYAVFAFFTAIAAFAAEKELQLNYPTAAQRAENTTLRVMSYNILAQRFNKKMFMRHAKERAPEIAQIIKTLAPDIAGLQELDPEWYPLLTERIKPYKFAVDPYDTTMCAIIYDSTKFRQIGGGNYVFVTGELRCLRYTVLESLQSCERLIITNTHWTLQQYARLANAVLMDRYIKELQLNYPGVPIICTGDFNCSMLSPELQYFLEISKFNDAAATAKETFNLSFSSTYDQHPAASRPKKGRHIDHIIFSPGITALNAGMVAGEIIFRASDHAPIVADLKIDRTASR